MIAGTWVEVGPGLQGRRVEWEQAAVVVGGMLKSKLCLLPGIAVRIEDFETPSVGIH